MPLHTLKPGQLRRCLSSFHLIFFLLPFFFFLTRLHLHLLLSDQFIPLLTRIDDCIAFLREHDKYQDSPTYLLRFQQLQNKALALVRAHITNTLKTATQNVMTQTQVRAHSTRFLATVEEEKWAALWRP